MISGGADIPNIRCIRFLLRLIDCFFVPLPYQVTVQG